MLTHSRIAELTLQLSGRLARPGQDPRSQRTGTSVGVGAFQSAIRATALCSGANSNDFANERSRWRDDAR